MNAQQSTRPRLQRHAIAALLGAVFMIGCSPDDGHGPDAGSTAADEHGSNQPSPQALTNLGVRVRTIKKQDFVRTVRVQAFVVDAPLNERTVTAPLGGIVTALHVQPGDLVRPGDPLLTLSRNPIPRPELPLTGALIPSISEDLHAAISRFRTARGQLGIVKKEITRVKSFAETGTDDGLPVLPKQTLIDLEYDRQRAELERDDAARELERHGLSTEEMLVVADGGAPPPNRRLWKRALETGGFWGPDQEAILAALPDSSGRLPWVVGALGELAASGHSSEALAPAVKASNELREHFPEAVSLLLEGHTVERVRWLAEQGAFQSSTVIRAPQGPPDWDVETIAVRPGRRVEEGAEVLHLHDSRTVWLTLQPVGRELELVTRALMAGSSLQAEPLIAGTGPKLKDLHIARITSPDAGGAYVVCKNEPLKLKVGIDAAARPRTWALRAGMRYLVQVPAEQYPQSYVIPAAGITSDGVETVVFVRHTGHFDSQSVRVLYRDEEVAVLADDGSLEDGAKVAISGAFALGMALQSGRQEIDPHAGHDHD